MTAPHSNGAGGQPSSELRLAVTFTGGVSLAVWMGGIAREMNLLLAASRIRSGDPVADTTERGARVRDKYAVLLDLLNLDCSVDVLSGTSAGGINAVILGLADVQRFDLDGLRELWFEEGSLGTLLRDPADKRPTSLLYGDKSLLHGLQKSLTALANKRAENPAPGDDPTRVFITTTLLSGEACRFTDEYGTLVRDVDHRGLFRFTSAQLTHGNVPALALAARCSASFPMAFEPALVPIGTDGGDGHPDMAEFTDAQATQFAADGGLLANRPLGPALQAVFDRPADRDVRRVLAYVVPVLGGGGVPSAKLTLADTPGLAAALRADVGAMLSQTISGDIAAISAHNQQVRARNDTRQQLAVMGEQMERLAAPFWDTYREQRAGSIARSASDEVLRRTTAGKRAADGRPTGFGADAEHALDAAHAAVQQVLPDQLPAIGDYDGMNAAGREALDDGRATVLAILSRAFQLVSSADDKLALGKLREQASTAMPGRHETSLAETVTRAVGVTPQPAGDVSAATTSASLAAAAARAFLDANMNASPDRQPWRELAAVVIGLRDRLAATDSRADAPAPAADDASGPAGTSAATYVRDLLDYLTGPTGGNQADTVAARLFDLHVTRSVMQPDGVIADQALELVQMSSDTRTGLDRRTLASEKLTGLQLHHFGAFYKASWRANDWMWGRLDGAGWLVHVLLDPRRLHQRAAEAPDQAAYREKLRADLEQIAGSPAPPGVWEPFAAHAGRPGAAAEMDFLTAATAPPPPTSLPVTAMWVAGGVQRIIAGEELAHVAEQVEKDTKAGAQESAARAFVSAYHNATGTAAGSYPGVPDAKAAEVLHACQVSSEKLTAEMGSTLFTKTVTRAAAVSVKVADTGKLPTFLRPVLTGARTATSLAYRVTSVGPAARYPLFAGLILIALGVLASTSAIKLISAAGLAAVLAGLLLVAVGAARRIVLALAISAVAAGVALAAAAYIPFLRGHLFPWLVKSAIPNLAKHPAEWAILVVFVLLPPIWTVAVIVQRMLRGRAKAPARKAKKTAITAATTEPEPSLARTT
ncbi:MAG: patatin-like protein [Streptosporangiaceae bacterium]